MTYQFYDETYNAPFRQSHRMGQENDTVERMDRSMEAATERVVASVDDDSETGREALSEISEEGAITRTSIDQALAHLSKVVATPETRVEIAQRALRDAREAAAPIEGADTVRSRLNEFESRLTTLNERVDALGSQLSSLVDRAQAPDDLYAIGRAIREIRSQALDIQRGADGLVGEIEAFERKLRNPDRWAEELGEDIDAIETSISELREVAIDLSDARDDGGEGTDLASRWVDAALQNRMQKLFIEDVRVELGALRQMTLDQEIDSFGDRISRRLEELESVRTDVSRRLGEVSEPSWRQNHDETIESFTQTLEDFDPPVDWTKLQERL